MKPAPLAQGLHAQYLVDDFGAGARFVAAVGEAGDALGHHPRVSIGKGHVSSWSPTTPSTATTRARDRRRMGDPARRRPRATHHRDRRRPQARRRPGFVCEVELGLDTARSTTIAPVWAALLTGSAESQGRGTPGDEIRDATGRVPNLWFGDADESDAPCPRFHIEVYVPPEAAEQRIAAAVAAGETVVDESDAPSLTVIADQDGNKGVVCVDVSAATRD